MSKTTFSKDEKNATLTMGRVFPAKRARVWRALTDPALLDQWWGPAPWTTETLEMDFRVGGHWFYSMNGPEGERHYCRMDYVAIEPDRRVKSNDYFTDADGKVNDALPLQVMDMTLVEEAGQTRFVTVVQYASLDDMNKILDMGMREGFTMAQDQLEALLARESAA